MKSIKLKDIEWFFEDEAIKEILPLIEFDARERRGYKIITVENKSYFLKSFREKGLNALFRRLICPRGKKEFFNGMKLLSLSIATPQPIAYGVSKHASYIIQGYINGKNFLENFFSSGDKKELLIKLALLLKKLNSFRIRHNDLHLNNILIEDETLYVVDLHKMKFKRKFSLSDELSNITHSLAMIYHELTEEEKSAFFSAYGRENIREKIESTIEKMRKKWIENKKKRAFEDTSIIKRKKGTLFIKNHFHAINDVFVERIKKDKKVEVIRYTDHVKKIYRDRRRLKKAWEAYVVLTYMGLELTPEVYLLKLPQGSQRGFIAMEDLKEKGEELDRYLHRHYNRMDFKGRTIFIERLATFLKSILKKDIFHKDLKACNIFVKQDGGFLFFDLEDFIFKRVDTEDLKGMFIQLNTTVPKFIKNTDRLRFFFKITEGFNFDKKILMRKIARLSINMDIVYEGTDGMRIERFR